MKTIQYIFALCFLFSCQGSDKQEKKTETKKEKTIPVHANAQLDFSVEGMVCQMGCGGSMRKELKNAGGVERVDVNFVEDQKIQKVTVSYDSLMISAEKISSILNTINDKQFTAKIIAKKSI